ncbi:MAG TPA: hypothetical protein VIM20_05715 [Candidatus Limnocylindrales bacterium]
MTRAGTDALEEVPPRAAGRDRRLSMPSRFTAALVGAGSVVGLAAILVVLDGTSVASDLLPVLIGAAGVCLALIARRSAPGLAWMALILASLVAASIPIGLSRAADPQLVGLGRWLVVAIRASAAAIATVAIAALYATRPERQLTARVSTLASFLVAWLAVACLVVVVLVIAGARADPDFNLVDIATTPTALFVHFVLLLAGLGVAGDLRAAAIRADGDDDRDLRRGRMPDGVVEGQLGDPPRGSLDLRARSACRLVDLEGDLDGGFGLGPFREVLERIDQPECLENHRPAIRHQPLELEIDGSKSLGEVLDREARFGLGDRATERRQDDCVEVAGKTSALRIESGGVGVRLARDQLPDDRPEPMRDRPLVSSPTPAGADQPPVGPDRRRPEIAGDAETRKEQDEVDEQRGRRRRDVDEVEVGVRPGTGDHEDDDHETGDGKPGDQEAGEG